jgi:hypothetical protein
MRSALIDASWFTAQPVVADKALVQVAAMVLLRRRSCFLSTQIERRHSLAPDV